MWNNFLGNLEPLWTCDSTVKRFPMIFGMSYEDCVDDVVMKGFDVDSSGSFLISGFVGSSTTTHCTAYTNAKVGNVGYLTFVNNYGILNNINML